MAVKDIVGSERIKEIVEGFKKFNTDPPVGNTVSALDHDMLLDYVVASIAA